MIKKILISRKSSGLARPVKCVNPLQDPHSRAVPVEKTVAVSCN